MPSRWAVTCCMSQCALSRSLASAASRRRVSLRLRSAGARTRIAAVACFGRDGGVAHTPPDASASGLGEPGGRGVELVRERRVAGAHAGGELAEAAAPIESPVRPK